MFLRPRYGQPAEAKASLREHPRPSLSMQAARLASSLTADFD